MHRDLPLERQTPLTGARKSRICQIARLFNGNEQQGPGGVLPGDKAVRGPPSRCRTSIRHLEVRSRKIVVRLAPVADRVSLQHVLQQPRLLLPKNRTYC